MVIAFLCSLITYFLDFSIIFPFYSYFFLSHCHTYVLTNSKGVKRCCRACVATRITQAGHHAKGVGHDEAIDMELLVPIKVWPNDDSTMFPYMEDRMWDQPPHSFRRTYLVTFGKVNKKCFRPRKRNTVLQKCYSRCLLVKPRF